jgi:ribosomal protein S12 methylthiotransferase
VGCFSYSAVDGAAANALPNPIPEEIKEQRRARFMAAQETISARRLQRKVGQTLDVLIDEVSANRAVGRSSADAPEIDGVVHVRNARALRPGSMARVAITRADIHDLHGKLVV